MPVALIAGASGLTGHHCLSALLADSSFTRVLSLGRSKLALSHPKLEQHTFDFAKLAEATRDLGDVDAVFCCLGTTIRKAGSQEAFYQVDVTYVEELARLAQRLHAQTFLMVSAMGAHPRSKVFYSRCKGIAEDKVKAFAFPSLSIFRPSLLLGARPEPRPLEDWASRAATVLAPLWVGPLKRYRPIAAKTVAEAMVACARSPRPGCHIIESAAIEESLT